MKVFGIILIVVGSLGLLGGAALGFLPFTVEAGAGTVECGSLILSTLDAATRSACLPEWATYAWMTPSAAAAGLFVLMLGVVFVQSGRIRDLQTSLAYARSSKTIGVAASATPLSGNGIPVERASGITSNEQASYAAKVGYTTRPVAPDPSLYTAPPVSAPAAEPAGVAYPGAAAATPAAASYSAVPTSAPPPQPQHAVPQPQPFPSDAEIFGQPPAAQPAYPESAPAPAYPQPDPGYPQAPPAGDVHYAPLPDDVQYAAPQESAFPPPAFPSPVAPGSSGEQQFVQPQPVVAMQPEVVDGFIQPGSGFVPPSAPPFSR